MKLAPIADKVTSKISPTSSFEDIWEACDLASGGELDTTQMDILADMVLNRLSKKNVL